MIELIFQYLSVPAFVFILIGISIRYLSIVGSIRSLIGSISLGIVFGLLVLLP